MSDILTIERIKLKYKIREDKSEHVKHFQNDKYYKLIDTENNLEFVSYIEDSSAQDRDIIYERLYNAQFKEPIRVNIYLPMPPTYKSPYVKERRGYVINNQLVENTICVNGKIYKND